MAMASHEDGEENRGSRRRHFLVVTYPVQGHINPGRNLAGHLVRAFGARVTFCTSVSGHRRMFPGLSSPDQEVEEGGISYIPFTDGYDEGYKEGIDDPQLFMKEYRENGARNVVALVRRLADLGRPVTCAIYTLLLSWVEDVARDAGIPAFLYWIQSATVLSIYYHYFHGGKYKEVISSHAGDASFEVEFPGLPTFLIRELPSFVREEGSLVMNWVRLVFEALDREAAVEKPRKHKVLITTFDALEPDALASIYYDGLELTAIAPLLPLRPTHVEAKKAGDLFKPDDEEKYISWLNAKPDGSVVYVSFGSLTKPSRLQLGEISGGLRGSRRPYLWVVRNDTRGAGGEEDLDLENEGEGMVVEWCSQTRVLSHPAVGCFVTHCGWNSTMESLACGVPMVCWPQWSDQNTNAKLVDAVWGTGVRAETDADGALPAAELKRCLEVVMGEGDDRGREIRKQAALWRELAREAANEGGSSDRNLRAFVEA